MDSVTRCQNRKAKQKVVSVIENVCEEICEEYCKYPIEYADFDEMLEKQCEDCPLNRL